MHCPESRSFLGRLLPRGKRRGALCGVLLGAAGLVVMNSSLVGAGFYDTRSEKVGCSSYNLDQVELKTIFQDIARELCTDSCGECGKQNNACGSAEGKGPESESHRAVMVADFVDLQNLQPNQYGILMGELMRGTLNSGCCYRIVQAEFSKYFKLTESGLVVLSRNVNDIKSDKFYQTECIVGTYSFLPTKLILFVRKINTITGQISRMVIREIDFSCSQGKVIYTVK